MSQQLDTERQADPWAAPATFTGGGNFDLEEARRRIAKRTPIAVGFVAASSVLNLVFSIPGLSDKLIPGETEEITLLLMQLLPLVGLVVAAIGAIVVFLMWVHAASKNLRVLYPDAPFEYSPGWAVGWWFVPIANLWKPYNAMQEIWSYSRPRSDTSSEVKTPAPLSTWWGFWVIAVILDRVAAKASDEVGTLDLIAASSRAAAGVFCILVVRAICDLQLKAIDERIREANVR